MLPRFGQKHHLGRRPRPAPHARHDRLRRNRHRPAAADRVLPGSPLAHEGRKFEGAVGGTLHELGC